MTPGEREAPALQLVATPIGNLGDITARAVDALRTCDCVVAEDTRRTRALLTHLGIEKKPLKSLNAHGTAGAVNALVELMKGGQRLTYVTDAGTPGVSDPGQALAEAAVHAGLSVSAVPGPSAVTLAVALCGFVQGPFSFLGFLPRRGPERRAALERIEHSAEPTVLFESPHRLHATVTELAAAIPQRRAFVGRELTKLHEQCLWESVQQLADRGDSWRGELVMVVAGSPPRASKASDIPPPVAVALRVALQCGANPSRIARALAEACDLPRRPLYTLALQWAEEEAGAEPD